MTDTSNTFGPKEFWRTLGERAVGMTIVTAQGQDGPAGFLGLSATHVSADPPTMLVSIDENTSALAAVIESRAFAINYLPASGTEAAARFDFKSAFKGSDRFEAGAWTTLKTGAPVFKNALSAFDCEVEDVIKRGKTNIVIGRVVDLSYTGGTPLVYLRGKTITLD